MKKLLLLAIMGMFLVSCGGGGWSDEDKNYLRSEIKSEVYDEFTDFENGYTMREEFCNCFLDAAMDEWSSLDDMENDSYSDGYDWGFEQAQKCADKVGFEFGGGRGVDEDCLIGYDWCYPNCNNATGAWKFNSDNSFNYSTTMFGGMYNTGTWTMNEDGNININGRNGSQTLEMPDCNTLKVGTTLYEKE